MTIEKFNKILDRVYFSYADTVKEQGKTLVFKRLWSSNEYNAKATREADKYIVEVHGGLARSTRVTEDSLMLIVCHELGHHLGGAPTKVAPFSHPWSSAEGQADYFATMKCMRKVIENDDNEKIISKIKVDPDVIKKCSIVYNSAKDIALCKRIAVASLTYAYSTTDLGETLYFNKPATYKAAVTNEMHPTAQCRLDTLYSGILCNKSYDQEFDPSNASIGACTAHDGFKLGVRPRCWYKPDFSEL